ncbi:MAG: hypothetical protein WA073_04915, partial [Gemmiger qucibialis]
FAASSIICAFGLASAAPRSPYRHLELYGIALDLPVPAAQKFYHGRHHIFRPARQPHRTFFALHQQLPVSAANYYRNAFLYSFFKCIFVAIF